MAFDIISYFEFLVNIGWLFALFYSFPIAVGWSAINFKSGYSKIPFRIE